MTVEGIDWLALTTEPVLEPELLICDAHHHFWDKRPERAPNQRYLLDDLISDIGQHNVSSTVYIEDRSMYRSTGPDELRPVGEVEFAQGLAAASASDTYGPVRAASAIVGHANLNRGEKVAPVLEALQAASPNRFRGIRHTTTWDDNPDVQNSAAHRQPGQLASDPFRAGARELARRGLSYEAFLNFHQLHELADFARAVPELSIVLNHLGGLIRVGPYAGRDDEVYETWRKGMAAVAACKNVTIKLGGLGMRRNGFDFHLRERPIGSEELAQTMAPLIAFSIEQFGPQRSMFESNFPADKVSFSYNVVWNAFKRVSSAYSATERADMFHDTAVRIYRIGE